MPNRNSARKVLLAVREGYIDPHLLASARSLCERMDAELDILARVGGETLPADLAKFIKGLRADDVAYSLSQKPELRRRDIVQYANTHECIATVVIEDAQGGFSYLPDRDVQVVRDWLHRPYVF